MPSRPCACPAFLPAGLDHDPIEPAANVVEHLDHGAQGGRRLLLTGPLASGRTATLRAWLTRQPSTGFQHVFSAGSDPDNSTPASVIYGLLSAIRAYLDVSDALPLDEAGLREALPGWLARLSDTPAILVIDDLDRITGSDLTGDPDWLPPYLPPGLILIASAERGLLAERLRELGWERVDIARGPQMPDPTEAIATAGQIPAQAFSLKHLVAAPNGLRLSTLAALGIDPTALPTDLIETNDQDVRFRHAMVRDVARRTLLAGSVEYRAICGRLAEATDDALDRATWLARAADWPGLMAQLTQPDILTSWDAAPFAWQSLWAALPARDTAVSHLVSHLERRRADAEAAPDALSHEHINAGRILDNLEAHDAAAHVRRSGYEHLRQIAPNSLGAAALSHHHAVSDLTESATERAISMLRVALEQRRRGLGEADALVQSSGHALAAALEANGDLNAAIAEYAALVAKREAEVGRDDPALLSLLSNLGAAQRAANQLEQARGPFERCVKIAQRIQPGPAPALAIALDNLAGLLYGGGDHEGAEARYREALDITQRLFGPGHPATAAAVHNLGTALDTLSRFPEAKRCFRRAVEIRTEALGREHAETATSLHNLAGVLDVTGEREESEALYREAIDIWRAVVGADHPATATSINNLADLLRENGRLDEAEPLYRENLTLWTNLYGEHHPNTAMTAAELGGLYADAGRSDEAEPLLRDAIQQLEAMMGIDDTLHIDSLCRLAALLRDRGRAQEGVALLESTYERAAGSAKILSPALQKLRRHLDGLRQAAGAPRS